MSLPRTTLSSAGKQNLSLVRLCPTGKHYDAKQGAEIMDLLRSLAATWVKVVSWYEPWLRTGGDTEPQLANFLYFPIFSFTLCGLLFLALMDFLYFLFLFSFLTCFVFSFPPTVPYLLLHSPILCRFVFLFCTFMPPSFRAHPLCPISWLYHRYQSTHETT